MNSFVVGVISSLVATIVIAGVLYSKGVVSLTWAKYRYKRGLADRLFSGGITNFYFSRKDYTRHRDGDTLEAYLQKNGRRTIKIVGLWMAESMEMEGIVAGLRSILEKPEFASMEIALIDPSSAILVPLAKLLDAEPEQVRSRVQRSLSALHDMKAGLNPSVAPKLRLKVYDALPIASVIMLDDAEPNGRIQFDFKIYRAPRTSSFGFEITNTGSAFYKLCRERYDLLLSDAEDYSGSLPLRPA